MTPETPITDIDLAAPAVRALDAAGYRVLRDLEGATEPSLMQLHGMGPNAYKKLYEALKASGIMA